MSDVSNSQPSAVSDADRSVAELLSSLNIETDDSKGSCLDMELPPPPGLDDLIIEQKEVVVETPKAKPLPVVAPKPFKKYNSNNNVSTMKIQLGKPKNQSSQPKSTTTFAPVSVDDVPPPKPPVPRKTSSPDQITSFPMTPTKSSKLAPVTPAPSTPAASTPASATPVSTTPVPSRPASSAPASATPAPSTPAPSTPAASTPAPSTPAPSTPAPSTPAPSTPAPSTPAPSTPAPSTPASATPAASTPASRPSPATSFPTLSLDGNTSLNDNNKTLADLENDLDYYTRTLLENIDNPKDEEFYGYCAKCNGVVAGEEVGCKAFGKIYHIACFNCETCGVSVHGVQFYAVDEKPYCEKCYLDSLEKCAVCKNLITDKIIRAGGKAYHPECFVCCVSSKPLDGIPFITDDEGLIYCVEEYYNKYAPKCSVCGEAILPENGTEETVKIVALDRDFHVLCYKCVKCGIPLSSGKDGKGCYPLDGEILCLNCNTMIASK